jgi:hypothetical protein
MRVEENKEKKQDKRNVVMLKRCRNEGGEERQ